MLTLQRKLLVKKGQEQVVCLTKPKEMNFYLVSFMMQVLATTIVKGMVTLIMSLCHGRKYDYILFAARHT